MNSKGTDRRQFLKSGAVLAGLAAGGSGILRVAHGQSIESEVPHGATPHIPHGAKPRKPKKWDTDPRRLYGQRIRFEKAIRTYATDGWHLSLTPLQDLTGSITPSGLHFTVMNADDLPEIDPEQHRLLIHGMVERPLIFTMAELKCLPSVSRVHFVECAGNTDLRYRFYRPWGTVQQTHGGTSCSEWTGVPLSLLLKEAGVKQGASWVLAEGAEQGMRGKSIPLAKAMHDVLVAYGQNGEAIRAEQGYPIRLLVPGWEGQSNVKWLKHLKVVDRPYMAKQETTGDKRPDGKEHIFQFEMPPKSVITFPSGEQRLPRLGFYEITGLAWSGSGVIRKVEVSTDGGRTWKEAELQEPVHRMAHTRFRFPWNWNGKEATLQSRCTDDLGQVQPTLEEWTKAWGADMNYLNSLGAADGLIHVNPIWPWRISRNGSVSNVHFI